MMKFGVESPASKFNPQPAPSKKRLKVKGFKDGRGGALIVNK